MDVTYHGAGQITKASRNPDGTVSFTASKAAGPDLDGDQQILDPQWLDKAMGSWFGDAYGGNLREQHGSTAAGKALTLKQPGNGDNFIDGVVVDPVSALKVEHGVLSGLSVGIKGARVIKDAAAPGGRVVGGRIVEVSLVDRPCNPTCKLQMVKSDSAGNPVFTEELTADKADQLEASVATIDARYKAISEGSETPDITGARAAIAAITPLIQHEIDGLTSGDQGEQYDVQDLLTALGALTSFLASEVAESQEDKMDDATKQEIAELVKAEVAEALKANSESLVEDLTKALKPEPVEEADQPDIAKMVTDAVVEAVKPFGDALAAVTAKVDQIPQGGGPAITRTAAVTKTEDVADPKSPAYWRAYAATPGLSPEMRNDALAKAEALS